MSNYKKYIVLALRVKYIIFRNKTWQQEILAAGEICRHQRLCQSSSNLSATCGPPTQNLAKNKIEKTKAILFLHDSIISCQLQVTQPLQTVSSRFAILYSALIYLMLIYIPIPGSRQVASLVCSLHQKQIYSTPAFTFSFLFKIFIKIFLLFLFLIIFYTVKQVIMICNNQLRL